MRTNLLGAVLALLVWQNASVADEPHSVRGLLGTPLLKGVTAVRLEPGWIAVEEECGPGDAAVARSTVLDVLKDTPLRILDSGLFELMEKGPHIDAPYLHIWANGRSSGVLDYCTIWIDADAHFIRMVGDANHRQGYYEYLWVRYTLPTVLHGARVPLATLNMIRQAARDFVDVWKLSQELPATNGK
jgi:hypothetical protein